MSDQGDDKQDSAVMNVSDTGESAGTTDAETDFGCVQVRVNGSEWIEVTSEGMVHCKRKDDQRLGNEAPVVKTVVTRQPIGVDAYTKPASPDGDYGIRIKFQTVDGQIDRRVVARGWVQAGGNALVEWIANRGLTFDPKSAGVLKQYFALAEPDRQLIAYDQTGWQVAPTGEAVFVYGDVDVIGATQESVFQPGLTTAMVNLRQSGTLAEWQANVVRPACTLPLWRFAIMTALSSPLLGILGEDNHGIHIMGETSKGKTISARCGASVYGKAATNGRDPYMSTWKATANGLEGLAEAYSDLFLVLDELAKADSKQVGNIIYMLNAGVGKTRMTDNTTLQRRKVWRVIAYSTGEQSLESKVREAGQRYAGGLSVRMLQINVDNTALLQSVSPDLVKRLEDATRTYYGTAGMAFIEKLLTTGYGGPQSEVVAGLKRRVDRIAKALMGADQDERRRRATQTFAIIQAAGELAVRFGILPPEIRPAETCKMVYEVWRRGPGKRDTNDWLMAAQRVRDAIDTKMNASIISVDQARNDGSVLGNSREREGYYQIEGEKRYVYLLRAALNKMLETYSRKTFLETAEKQKVIICNETKGYTSKVPELRPDSPRTYKIDYQRLQDVTNDEDELAESQRDSKDTVNAATTLQSGSATSTTMTDPPPPCFGFHVFELKCCLYCPFQRDCDRNTRPQDEFVDKIVIHEDVYDERVEWAAEYYPEMVEYFKNGFEMIRVLSEPEEPDSSPDLPEA